MNDYHAQSFLTVYVKIASDNRFLHISVTYIAVTY